MKINSLSPYHQGNQPIRVLQHNVIYQFEMTNPTFLELSKKIVAKKGLDPGISYHINNNPVIDGTYFQTPFVDAVKKIAIHETFLSYVWCIAYSMLVLYEEAVAKPCQNQFLQRMVNEIDQAKIKKAENLFDYAKSLIYSFTEWDKMALPNPELYDSTDAFWIERANALFLFAMNFILCHEFAHVEKEHIDQLIAGKNSVTHILVYEKEADQRAIDLVLLGGTQETKKTMEAGILIGLCCLLFFSRDSKAVTHPTSYDRITTFLEKLNPELASPLWGIATLALKLWDNQYSKDFVWPKEIDNFKELYYSIIAQIKK
jgi:hypothetical protein